MEKIVPIIAGAIPKTEVTNSSAIRSPMLEDEKRLIQGAQRGETSCFSALYDHYLPPIYRFIYLKVTHREAAEDLAHDVFLSAWQNIGGYEMQGFPFGSWLYQIARNKVIDFYRLRKNNTSLEQMDANLLKADPVLEVSVDRIFTLEEVKNSIRTLTQDQQDVLIMKFIEDLPHPQIAHIIQKSQGAVRLIQHRALKELKKRLVPENNMGNSA